MRDTVARFIEQAVADDVDLVEQRRGRNQRLYETTVAQGAAAHAVVIFCAGADDPVDRSHSTESDRVHVAFGWLCAMLGGRHVTALHEPGARWPEEPPDFWSTELDGGGGWQLPLLGDLDASGIALRPERLAGAQA